MQSGSLNHKYPFLLGQNPSKQSGSSCSKVLHWCHWADSTQWVSPMGGAVPDLCKWLLLQLPASSCRHSALRNQPLRLRDQVSVPNRAVGELSIKEYCVCVWGWGGFSLSVGGTTLGQVCLSLTRSSVTRLLSSRNCVSETGLLWCPQDRGQCYPSHKAKAEGQHLFSGQAVPITKLAMATMICSLLLSLC